VTASQSIDAETEADATRVPPSNLHAMLAQVSDAARAMSDLALAEARLSWAAIWRALALTGAATLIGLFAVIASIAAVFTQLREWLSLPSAMTVLALLLIACTAGLLARAARWRACVGFAQTRAVLDHVLTTKAAPTARTPREPSP
jgi:hypothetical protein